MVSDKRTPADPSGSSAAPAQAADPPLRVVVYTADGLSPADRVFYQRLADDPLIDFRGIVVDQYCRPRKSLPLRIYEELRKGGLPWVAYKTSTTLAALGRKIGLALYDRFHQPIDRECSFDEFSRATGVPIVRVENINDPACHEAIRALEPQLGAIVGGRILKEKVLKLAELGTLNIHKRKAPDYRGGGRIGYWEILAGESSIGVTIHYAAPQVDAGPILAEAEIPLEPCDTLESVGIKADIVGARLYHETIHNFARGQREGTPQDLTRGKTYRSAGEVLEHQLAVRLRRQAAHTMPVLRNRKWSWARLRVFVQYLLSLPLLIRQRNQLVRSGQAPIWMLYYHLVSNRPVNHMALPLEIFARQIDFIRRYYEIVSVDEAAERIRSGRNDAIAVAVTFDDGYRDNEWAIKYLKFRGIPACFFISVGNVEDQKGFEHDLNLGYTGALPMSEEDCRGLTTCPLALGSHGVYHEDFGRLDRDAAEQALRESKERLARITGQPPRHFSFPTGLRGINISESAFQLSTQYYEFVHSAYGGYNFPHPQQQHFLRFDDPSDLVNLLTIMDGYTGLRDVLAGDGWSIKSHRLPPYVADGSPPVAAERSRPNHSTQTPDD